MKVVGSLFLATSLLLHHEVHGDVYFHLPRGSNNRLNEASATRTNNNRLFDSQNNNRGGYNVGVQTSDAQGDDESLHYHMKYYQGSILHMEWTNQHGCGGNEGDDPHKPNCNIVLQYMCGTTLRNGQNTNTPDEDADNVDTGLHENQAYYTTCKNRLRNKDLFTADQDLNTNKSTSTRQNPNGDRSGLECPEERDYYPYWNPSPWVDIAILTDDVSRCDYYKANTQNTKAVGYCQGVTEDIPITPEACAQNGGQWNNGAAKGVSAPECLQSQWSRDNHLGNVRGGQMMGYNWTIPKAIENQQCVIRIRYNVTTDDYDPWNTFYQNNSVLSQNPTVNVDAHMQGFKLAINTAQYGRTFQDRSHIFDVLARPSNILDSTKIYNLNVRGKRGNIVQTYPAVEYDFVPNSLTVSSDDLVHIQWTGSNTHKNGNPGGDGQTGDDGQGQTGTDRNNLVQIIDRTTNFPVQRQYATLFKGAESLTDKKYQGEELASRLAASTDGDISNIDKNHNNASPSFNSGLVRFTSKGGYWYMCSRNNNFTNRSQKGYIKII